MLTRILVGVICVPTLFAVLLLLPPVATAIVVAGISGLASYELLRATKTLGLCTPVVVFSACAMPLCYWALEDGDLMVLVLTVVLLCALRRYGGPDAIELDRILMGFFGGLVIPFCLSSLVRMRMMEHGTALILLPFLCAFLTDAGAYFAGVFLGKHKGITKVSPNKSLEGYIGGILSGPVFLLAYGLVLRTAFQM